MDHIVEAIEANDKSTKDDDAFKKFRCFINNAKYEDILTYNLILQHIQNDKNTDIIWKLKRIISYEGPLLPLDKIYNGYSYPVRMEWETRRFQMNP